MCRTGRLDVSSIKPLFSQKCSPSHIESTQEGKILYIYLLQMTHQHITDIAHNSNNNCVITTIIMCHPKKKEKILDKGRNWSTSITIYNTFSFLGNTFTLYNIGTLMTHTHTRRALSHPKCILDEFKYLLSVDLKCTCKSFFFPLAHYKHYVALFPYKMSSNALSLWRTH